MVYRFLVFLCVPMMFDVGTISAAPALTAADYVLELDERMEALKAEKKPLPEKRARILALMHETYDFDKMTSLLLEGIGDQSDPQQRSDFKKIIQDNMAAVLISQVLISEVDFSPDRSFKIVGQSREGIYDVVVTEQHFSSPAEGELAQHFVGRRDDGSFYIADRSYKKRDQEGAFGKKTFLELQEVLTDEFKEKGHIKNMMTQFKQVTKELQKEYDPASYDPKSDIPTTAAEFVIGVDERWEGVKEDPHPVLEKREDVIAYIEYVNDFETLAPFLLDGVYHQLDGAQQDAFKDAVKEFFIAMSLNSLSYDNEARYTQPPKVISESHEEGYDVVVVEYEHEQFSGPPEKSLAKFFVGKRKDGRFYLADVRGEQHDKKGYFYDKGGYGHLQDDVLSEFKEKGHLKDFVARAEEMAEKAEKEATKRALP